MLQESKAEHTSHSPIQAWHIGLNNLNMAAV
jgi:hypothetical protein